MLQWIRSLFTASAASTHDAGAFQPAPPEQVEAPGIAPLVLSDVLRDAQGYPVLDWSAVQAWVDRIPDAASQGQAWAACEWAWFAHLREALGPHFQLRQNGSALLLSSLEPVVAQATLAYVNMTLQRIVRVLDGVAAEPPWGHDLLIVFDDEESYYAYASHYHPDGEFAASSGMYIDDGCGHFITRAGDLHAVEPTIAHELTHACLGHLPLPTWLNEGLAVNTERRLSPPAGARPNLTQMHARHQAYWTAERIQAFWSGASFKQVGTANELSYDLAQVLVAQLAADWERFRPFALHAQAHDAGAAAAQAHWGATLGALVCTLLDRPVDPAWEPALVH